MLMLLHNLVEDVQGAICYVMKHAGRNAREPQKKTRNGRRQHSLLVCGQRVQNSYELYEKSPRAPAVNGGHKMQLNMETDYAIRCLMYMGSRGKSVSSLEIGTALNLNRNYVQKILRKLRNAGLLTVARGSLGGYALARSADSMTMREIISAMEDTICINRCLEEDNFCSLKMCSWCGARAFFCEMQNAMDTCAETTTLFDLIKKRKLIDGMYFTLQPITGRGNEVQQAADPVADAGRQEISESASGRISAEDGNGSYSRVIREQIPPQSPDTRLYDGADEDISRVAEAVVYRATRKKRRR